LIALSFTCKRRLVCCIIVAMSTRTIFVDIDGTMTDEPDKSWGSPNLEVIDRVKQLIKDGCEVVVWSAGGTEYAKEFAERCGIKASACIGKPWIAIDDKSEIRTGGLWVMSPDHFLQINLMDAIR